ncbi:prevent-host-death protein [Chryseobacterium wangxinyae]|uniref:prevent-host-death protein n=1 Tax=Chryseobacterium sp. CY353 TaxID=2997334 RepID=UPI00226F5F79|nr:prevent-host-death protein [Chryseobacterium sp. CY353]MCY0969407.1 prevent-host-death protein [Chryseobacterium sp. CY353]
MDTNRFKPSQDFSNIEKNLDNNPGYSVESFSQQAKDYVNEMRSQNQEATKQGFLSHAQKSAHEVWKEIQEMASDAWEKNQNQSASEEEK